LSYTAITETTISSLPQVHRGKVRDIYAIGNDHLLLIATDRVSAFDVVMPKPLPGKGILLTKIALFWFDFIGDLIPNHLAGDLTLEDVLPDPDERAQAEGRSMIVKRLNGLPIEAVVRGYLIGSGWLDYQRTGQVCGIELPANLQMAQQLPEPLFTPATKAEVGDHDENISFAQMAETVGTQQASDVKEVSIEIYNRAARYAQERGIIIADTKFEFGTDDNGTLTLMDEVLTPDSSRFWNADTYAPGSSPQSYDKQFVRDYLETLDWNKTAPGPELPDDIMQKTLQRYETAYTTLTGATTG
jgi:phosphoribosylaminoimidazole-succinocarboxamide synthase